MLQDRERQKHRFIYFSIYFYLKKNTRRKILLSILNLNSLYQSGDIMNDRLQTIMYTDQLSIA